jgi:Secretion system C-terminal sorting domain
MNAMRILGLSALVLFTIMGSVFAQQLGDTLHVATTWVDQQHEASFGRMIGSQDDGSAFYMVWTQTDSLSAFPHVRVANLYFNDGTPNYNYSSHIWPGLLSYAPTIVTPLDIFGVIGYEKWGFGQDEYLAAIGNENPWVGIWNSFNYPAEDNGSFAPRISGADADQYFNIHSILYPTEIEDRSQLDVFYHRGRLRLSWSTIETTTPGADRLLVTDQATNHSGVIATSPDGSHVAIAQTVGRFNTLGEGTEGRLDNNDIYIWESDDGGDTWELGLENALNLTQFIEPNENALPDTMLANQDTMRVYGDLDVIYDDSNRLHVAFTAIGYYHYNEIASQKSRLYYWNSADRVFIMIADGNFQTGVSTPFMEPVICNPNLYWDEETDLLWCAWVQYGEPEDYDGEDDPVDASDDGFKASEIFVSATENQLLWAYGVNITNTRNEGTQLAPYETESEREMSLSLRNDGHYLHFFYTVDYDPGISASAGEFYEQPVEREGEVTDNHMIYHWVEKQDILNQFEYWGWPPQVIGPDNYPLHIDSTGFFEVGVEELGWDDSSLPDGFELDTAYPNPFNASTRIVFSLPVPDHLAVAIYDVLGREVARLADKRFSAGSHTLTFDGSDFASGVYFVRAGSSQYGEQAQKIVILK